jgi:hypothetical protein
MDSQLSEKMEQRLHETVTKVPTPFRGVFIHLSWDGKKIVGTSLSHQQKDLNAEIATILGTLSRGLHGAARAGFLKEIVAGLHGAIEAGP